MVLVEALGCISFTVAVVLLIRSRHFASISDIPGPFLAVS